MHHPLRFPAMFSAVSLFLGACASMSIKEETIQGAPTLARPSVIYVRSFAPGSDWRGDFGGLSRDAFIAQEIPKLDQRLLVQLAEVAPTAPAPAILPAQGYLVSGTIKHVDAGSGAARFWIGGYGGGAREVTGRVLIFDLAKSSTSPMLSFDIEGGSRGEGGIIGAVSNLDSEWDRIARETRNLLLKRLQ
jgi:hypothetical protein